MTYEIRTLGFLDDGLTVEFVDVVVDVRTNGLLMNHALLIPDSNEYHDEIEALRQRALALLADAMEDWDAAEPASGVPEDSPGPYDNPLEREIGSPS